MKPILTTWRRRAGQSGYVLPTVIVLSLGIIIISVTAMDVISTSSVTLQDQYYRQLAREAAQSGVTAATSCIKGGTTTWPAALTPTTDCSGAASTSPNYIGSADNWQSSYSVPTPSGTNPILFTSTGTVTLKTSGGTTLKTYSVSLKGRVGQTTSSGQVKNVTAMATSTTHSCALAGSPGATDAVASCWGYNKCGQNGNSAGGTTCLGLPSSRTDRYPTATAAAFGTALHGKVVTGISTSTFGAKNTYTCATAYTSSTADAKAYCWGYVPAIADTGDNGIAPTQIGGPLASMTVTSVSAGSDHACATAYAAGSPANVQLYCWGRNVGYAVGTGGNTLAVYATPTLINGGDMAGKKLISVSAGFRYTCALAYTTATTDARPYCWGLNNQGQLGTGNTTTQSLPKAVVTTGVLSSRIITAIAAGSGFNSEDDGSGTIVDTPYPATCAVAYPSSSDASQSAVYCWGQALNGTIGDGTSSNKTSPVAVTAGAGAALNSKTVTAVAVGGRHACAVAYPNSGTPAQSAAYCWGNNLYGPLGDGSSQSTTRLSPVAVSTSGALNGKTVTSITAGMYTTCATAYTTSAATDSRAYCWGYAFNGAIGNGVATNPDYYNTPQAVDVSTNSSIGPTLTTSYGSPIIY